MKKQKSILLIFATFIALTIITGIIITNKNNDSKFRQQLNLGEEALLNIDYEAAIIAFTNAIDLDPKSMDAYLGISKAYIALDDYANASDYLSKGYYSVPAPTILEMLDPIEVKDLVILGNTFLSKKEANLAENAFEEALKKDPTNEEAQKGLEDTKNHTFGSGSNTENTNSSNGSNNNSTENNNTAPSKDNVSVFEFDPYGFTFMGYPIYEDHYEEWLTALGCGGSDISGDTVPGNGYADQISYWMYEGEKGISLDIKLSDTSSMSYISWGVNSAAVDYYKYSFTICPDAGGYGQVAKEHFAGPIQPGDSVTNVLSLCQNLPAEYQLTSSEYDGNKSLFIMGPTFNIVLSIKNDQVSELFLMYL